MITKEERECTIATIERDAELRGMKIGEAKGVQIGEARGVQIGEAKGMKIGEARERQKSAETIAKLETKIKELERQLAQMS